MVTRVAFPICPASSFALVGLFVAGCGGGSKTQTLMNSLGSSLEFAASFG
jgi:hypothetical protein